MKRKQIIVSILSLAVALTFFLLPVTYAATPNAPFWYGTEDGYVPPQNPLYDPTLPYNSQNSPPTMLCEGAAPSLTANFQANMFPIFFFNNNPTGFRGLSINKPEAWDGYTLLSCQNGCAMSEGGEKFDALLIDNAGNFLKGWYISPFPVKMHPGGYVMGSEEEADLGAESHSLVMQDWCGTEVRRWELTDDIAPGCIFHHDLNSQGSPVGYYAPGMAPKFEGKTLALAMCSPDQTTTSHISNFPLQDDTFFIFAKKDKNGDILVHWRWNAWEHFEQMGFSQKARDVIMNTKSAGAIQDPAQSDWLHMNNLNWLGKNKWYDKGDMRFHPDNLIFDSRSSSLIAIVANDDYAGFKKGDIIWRVGPDYGPSTPWASLGQIIGPHHAHIIPASLPGGGNILVFDNGGLANYGPLREDCPGSYPNALSDYSRVIEFNPQTYEVVWEYKNTADKTDDDGTFNRKFFSAFMSSAQRLANGNTLITEANSGRIFEVTKKGKIVWEYMASTGDTRPGIPGLVGAAVYRAYKVPKSWVPSDMNCPQ